MSTTIKPWALILGASSGFGQATAIKLAQDGFNILGVHLDRKATMPVVEETIKAIEATGNKALFYNVNAADPKKRDEILDNLQDLFKQEPGEIKVLLHTLAFGVTKKYITEEKANEVEESQMDMTLRVMAHTLVYWTQEAFHRDFLKKDARIFAMTSSGGHRVIENYGPVSAAKAALESHIRQLSIELAPYGITANSIQAGVTDTPALRKIPGHEILVKEATDRNPSGRLTTPEDVADIISLLVDPRANWLTGNIIRVDGGEDIIV